jgi:hypothetical protein
MLRPSTRMDVISTANGPIVSLSAVPTDYPARDAGQLQITSYYPGK